MDAPSSIRAFRLGEWPVYRDLRLRALEDSPDAFGSTLARERPQPDAWWKERLETGVVSPLDHPLVAEVSEEPVGLAWGRIGSAAPERADLYQMWVAPHARRLGLGGRLLDEVIAWARRAGVSRVVLGVTAGNSAATRLYERAGFVAVGRPQPLRPGSVLRVQEMEIELRGGSP